MVPQFIDVEDKIIGPVTTRQFVICLVGSVLIFVTYKLFRFWIFSIVGLLILAAAGTIAFLRINGRPFHFFLLNFVQTFRRPRLKVWRRDYTDAELRTFIREVPVAPPPPPPRKAPLTSSKLQEIALVLNTGGVYRPD
ncbi:MAG: PrgI family protein [Candidatus Uhrbacteria bacterium]